MTERATSTVASAFGVADMMIMNIIIALAMVQTSERLGLLHFATLILLAGCIAAGEFSGYIGLAAALFAFGVISGRFHQLLPVGIAGGGLAALLVRRVIMTRLEGCQGSPAYLTVGLGAGTIYRPISFPISLNTVTGFWEFARHHESRLSRLGGKWSTSKAAISGCYG
jgi:hypothetical protein